jgi:hypothetical protein
VDVQVTMEIAGTGEGEEEMLAKQKDFISIL